MTPDAERVLCLLYNASVKQPDIAFVLGLSCFHCGRSFEKPKARSVHERDGHPGLSLPTEELKAREKVTKARWAAAHPRYSSEWVSAWRKSHPEQARERDRANRAKYRDQRRASSALWRAEHPEQRLETWQAWYAANSLHVVMQASLRRKSGQPPKHLRRESPDRWRARHAVAFARAAGDLIQEPCAMCGVPQTHAHHFLGYAPEHRLDVVWLCSLHHSEIHHPLIREARRLAERLGTTDLRASQRERAS